MKGKLLLLTTALFTTGQLMAYSYTCTFNNKTHFPVNIQFLRTAAIQQPNVQMVGPAGSENSSVENKSMLHTRGIKIVSINLPNNIVLGGSTEEPFLEEKFEWLGRACGTTWDLVAEERIERRYIGGLYSDVPVAIKFELYRRPCGGIGGSFYPGGLVRETDWISLLPASPA